MTRTQNRPGKERIRSPNLTTLVKEANGVPLEEALRRADDAGLVIASNKRLSQALIGSDEWKTIEDVFPCWSGTMVAFVAPGKSFRKAAEKSSSLGGYFIGYTDPNTTKRYFFPVPEEHLDKKDAVLVAEHPDYILEADGNNRIVRASLIDLIERFPASDGWYSGDPKHDIPSGDNIPYSEDAARILLWREAGGAELVGPIARYYYVYGNVAGGFGRTIVLVGWPGGPHGVVVEGTPEQIAAATGLLETQKK